MVSNSAGVLLALTASWGRAAAPAAKPFPASLGLRPAYILETSMRLQGLAATLPAWSGPAPLAPLTAEDIAPLISSLEPLVGWAGAEVNAARAVFLRDLAAPFVHLPRDAQRIASLEGRGPDLARRLEEIGDALRRSEPAVRRTLRRRLAAIRNRLSPSAAGLEAALSSLFDRSGVIEAEPAPPSLEPAWSRIGPEERWLLGELHAAASFLKMNAVELRIDGLERSRAWSVPELALGLRLAREDYASAWSSRAPSQEAFDLGLEFLRQAESLAAAAAGARDVLSGPRPGALHELLEILSFFELLLRRLGKSGATPYGHIRGHLADRAALGRERVSSKFPNF